METYKGFHTNIKLPILPIGGRRETVSKHLDVFTWRSIEQFSHLAVLVKNNYPKLRTNLVLFLKGEQSNCFEGEVNDLFCDMVKNNKLRFVLESKRLFLKNTSKQPPAKSMPKC